MKVTQSLGWQVRVLSAALAACLAAVSASAHNVLEVARNGKGQLVVHTHIHLPFPMPESTFGPSFPGYAVASVGLATTFRDEPDEDLFMLAPQANIELVLVAADPNLFLYNVNGSAVLPIGGTWACGAHPFHLHPLWQINPGVPAQTYTISFRFHDTSNTHADSEVFNLQFAPRCDGDVTVNGSVDIDDLVGVITTWGVCASCACDADLNTDCDINIDDLVSVITNWGNCR